VRETLVTNFFYLFGLLQELYDDQGHNVKSRLMQEILQRLEVSKKSSTSLHPQSEYKVKHYNIMVEENLRRVMHPTRKIGT
jgi:hypothetical protein